MKTVLEGNETYFGSAIFGGISLSDYSKEQPRENYLFHFILSYRIIATTVKIPNFPFLVPIKIIICGAITLSELSITSSFKKYTISLFE